MDNLGNCYDPKINPQISLEFNYALRFFHWFIRGSISLYDENNFLVPSGIRGKRPFDFDFPKALDNVDIYKNNLCGLTHGSCDTSWNLGGLSDNIHCKFFAGNSSKFGADLRSWDFQLCRENGEASYCDVLRKVYKVNKCDNDMKSSDCMQHDKGTQDFFSSRYGNVCNIGYCAGTDMETRGEAPVGATNGFFIAEQMSRTICGDRFWFNHSPLFTSS